MNGLPEAQPDDPFISNYIVLYNATPFKASDHSRKPSQVSRSMTKPILITGATGNQGGAVLEALLKQNNDEFVIIALTRDATSPSAKRLSARSKAIHVLQGNMDLPDAIFSEAQKLAGSPVWGVFMVQSVIQGGVTAAQEEAQGKAFINACVTNNVKFLVYTSVDRGGSIRSLEDPTPVSVFVSKHRIEQHLFKAAEKTTMSWLVLRPTGLIEPLLRNDFMAKLGRTSWKVYEQPGRKWQWVSCTDVGHFAVQGFLDPDRWSRQCLSLAGWEGSFAEANAIQQKATGQEFTLTFGLLARFVCGIVVKDLSRSWQWCNEKGFAADIEQLKKLHPGLLDIEACLGEQADVKR